MRWLRVDAVLAIHRRQIAEHGGAEGVRDIGLLESALARPKNIHSYKTEADIALLAASLAFGIARNHPFVDGNKRTALVVARTFLLLNGYNLNAAPSKKYLAIVGLADGTVSEADLTAWFRSHIEPLN